MDLKQLLEAHQKGLIDLKDVTPENDQEALTLSVLRRRGRFINALTDAYTGKSISHLFIDAGPGRKVALFEDQIN